MFNFCFSPSFWVRVIVEAFCRWTQMCFFVRNDFLLSSSLCNTFMIMKVSRKSTSKCTKIQQNTRDLSKSCCNMENDNLIERHQFSKSHFISILRTTLLHRKKYFFCAQDHTQKFARKRTRCAQVRADPRKSWSGRCCTLNSEVWPRLPDSNWSARPQENAHLPSKSTETFFWKHRSSERLRPVAWGTKDTQQRKELLPNLLWDFERIKWYLTSHPNQDSLCQLQLVVEIPADT